MAASKKVTARQAITKVLTDAGATTKSKAVKVPTIIAGVKATKNLGLSGDNQGQTVYSILYSENKKADGDFLSVGKGLFILNPKRRSEKAAPKTKAPAVKAVKADAVEVTPDPKPEPRKRAARKPKDGTAGPKGLAALLPTV